MNSPIDITGVTIQEANNYLVHLVRQAREINNPDLGEWDKPAVLMVGADYFPHLEALFAELTRLYALEDRMRRQRSTAGGSRSEKKAAAARKNARTRRKPRKELGSAALYQRARAAAGRGDHSLAERLRREAREKKSSQD